MTSASAMGRCACNTADLSVATHTACAPLSSRSAPPQLCVATVEGPYAAQMSDPSPGLCPHIPAHAGLRTERGQKRQIAAECGEGRRGNFSEGFLGGPARRRGVADFCGPRAARAASHPENVAREYVTGRQAVLGNKTKEPQPRLQAA